MTFVHLDVSSTHGLVDGMVDPTAAVARCQESGMPALALTDPGTMLSSAALLGACRATLRSSHPVKPIFGCAILLHPGNAPGWNPPADAWGRPLPGWRLVLLARNREGYANLCSIVSAGFSNGYTRTPLVGLRHLRAHANGIIALSGGRAGSVSTLLRRGDPQGAQDAALAMGRIFEDFHLQAHESDRRIHQDLQDLGSALNLSIVATQEARYLDPRDAEAHARFRRGRFRTRDSHPSPGKHHLATPAEMAEAFPDRPDWLSNAVKLAEGIDAIDLRSEPLKALTHAHGSLRQRAESAMARRITIDPTHHAWLESECTQVEHLGCELPFLAWAALADAAARRGLKFRPIKGAVCRSMLAWTLGFSEDPLLTGIEIPIFHPNEGVEWCFELPVSPDSADDLLESLLPEAFPGMQPGITDGTAAMARVYVEGAPPSFGRCWVPYSGYGKPIERWDSGSDLLHTMAAPSALAAEIPFLWGTSLQVPIHDAPLMGLLPLRVWGNRNTRPHP
ncbi:PHP domain-containing protein [Holophaga foetida]|uniref:PHP domain-containing protein n=1 Tax=Holophaga foetida TaxID=35839 RepID=UPI0002471744|nr:PHP domain-containing protein [Holophaga foetida]